MNCTELDAGDYWGITWTAAAELPGMYSFCFSIDLVAVTKECVYIRTCRNFTDIGDN